MVTTRKTLITTAIIAICFLFQVSLLRADKLYWVDPVTGTLYRANPDGSAVETILTNLISPHLEMISLDPDNGKIYWNNGYGAIQRAHLDGSFAETVITSPAAIGDLAIDRIGEKIYWVSNHQNIMRANLDGTDTEQIASSPSAGGTTGLDIDEEGGKVYWADAISDRIYRANLDGSEMQDTGVPTIEPWDVAIDSANGRMYWAQYWGYVYSARLDGSDVKQLYDLRFYWPLFGITVDTWNDRLYVTNGYIFIGDPQGGDGHWVLPVVGGKMGNLGVLHFTIVNPPPSFALGRPVYYQLTAVGGVMPLTWQITNGTLPSGLHMSEDGVVTGTPDERGASTFTLQVTDAARQITKKAWTMDTVLMPSPSAVRVSKGGTLPVPGRLASYWIYVENTGTEPITDWLLEELLHPAANFTYQASQPAARTLDGELLYWPIDIIKAGQGKLFAYTVEINPTVPLGTPVAGPAKAQPKTKTAVRETVKELLDHAATLQRTNTGCRVNTDCVAATYALCVEPGPYCIEELPWSQCLSCLKAAAMCVENCPPDGVYPTSWAVSVGTASGPKDPNEKIVLAKRFVQPDQTLIYPIHFENTGTVAAIDVFVNDVLDPNLDASTVDLLTPEGASFDAATGTVSWELLNRNLQPSETGNVLLAVKPLPGLLSGTEIRNAAEIQFESFAPLVTPEVANVIDSTKPNCVMDVLPAETPTESFTVSWTGTDEVGEIAAYAVFVSKDGAGWQPSLTETTETSAQFTGENGSTYEFLCAARDTAGNVEEPSLVAETRTTVVTNKPPMAQCQDVTVPTDRGVCSASIAAVNAGSYDPDGDAITVVQAPAGPYQLGATSVTLTVTDDHGASDACSAVVTVVDETVPTVAVTVTPATLWPPNHKMVPVAATVTASDACDPSPTVNRKSITMNEGQVTNTYDPNYDDTVGDGNTVDDIQIDADGNISLRAERSGTGTGRVYTVTYQATDASGNTADASATVTVPHDQE